ncbi:molybdenum cofactor guanylyltransferase [Microbulbifer sp. M83]|uniref:molybdenum cofactor guanylyltransferase n=1 Tax=Microbulbifer sp. M83 TaxID=3118246 RepID=UPI002FE22A37
MADTRTSIICPVVLAGGGSRRMGQDKAAMVLPGGETLLERAVGHLEELRRQFPARWLATRVSGAAWGGVADIGSSRGPVSGLHAIAEDLAGVLEPAAGGAGPPAILAVPVDMPLLTVAPLAALCRAGVGNGARALCYERLWLPLWLRLDDNTRDYLRDVSAGRGDASLRQLVHQLGGTELPVGESGWQMNVNCPAEFSRLLRILGSPQTGIPGRGRELQESIHD